MPMFVPTEPVPVVSGAYTVWIRPRMGLDLRNKVRDVVFQLTPGAGGEVEVTRHLNEYNTALLIHNIVRWEGPGLPPLTPEAVRSLDPSDPEAVALVDAVLARIQECNAAPVPLVKSPAGATESISGGG